MDNNWHWQEPGTAWKGIGIYHMTLTTAGRRPILGKLEIPEQDPAKAYVAETPLAKDLVQCLLHLHEHFPEIRVLQFCVMPDHLHAIIHVWRPMPRSIRMVARSFFQAAKRLSSPRSADSHSPIANSRSSIASALYADIPASSDTPSPLFSEKPFLRPLSRHGQLNAMIRYVQMNPARLATKRIKPGFFCVQPDIDLAGRIYSGVGNTKLLMSARFVQVHVSHDLVDKANAGNPQPLREYMDGCIAAARQGAVLVSPFISQYEKEILSILLAEHLPFILLTDNGFRDYYKPTDALFDAVDAGNVLILSPFQHNPSKRGITRSECVALNGMAADISAL